MRPRPYHHDRPLLFEGSVGLQVHWFGRYAGYPEWQIGRERLAAHMIAFFFVESSTCWCELNGSRLNLEAGDLLIVQGADEFEFGHDQRHPHVSLSACLAVSQGSEPNVLLQRAMPRRIRWPEPEAYVKEFEKVMAAMTTHSSGRDFTTCGALLQWLGYILSHLNAPVRSGKDAVTGREVVERILHSPRWATEHLRHAVTMEEWARSAGMHPVYFGRVFKRETGRRPMEWLNERRLQIAVQQLTNTPRTIGEIAEDCGFACPFYFSRVFKHRFGRPPSSFRSKASQT